MTIIPENRDDTKKPRIGFLHGNKVREDPIPRVPSTVTPDGRRVWIGDYCCLRSDPDKAVRLLNFFSKVSNPSRMFFILKN